MKTAGSIPVKKLILTGTILFLFYIAYGQREFDTFCQQSNKLNNAGMLVLGGWAVANIATGAYGWSQYSNENKYFYQMNLFWNVVNLSIAGIALYNNHHFNCSLLGFEEMTARHEKTERILLINTALDLGYIGTGFLLRYLSTRTEKRSSLMKGYGNSLLLQGSFLLLFDFILYQIMRDFRMDFLSNLNLSVSPQAAGLKFIMNL